MKESGQQHATIHILDTGTHMASFSFYFSLYMHYSNGWYDRIYHIIYSVYSNYRSCFYNLKSYNMYVQRKLRSWICWDSCIAVIKLLGDKPSELRAVIKVADKFVVASCIKLCGQLLINLEITLEVALLYLDLDLNGLMVDFVKPHLDTAKNFIAEHFTELNEWVP